MSTKSTSPLSAFSACEASDALIKLGLPHGGYIPDINMFSPSPFDLETRICGPAYNVKMVLASDSDAPKLSEHFVDTAPNGSVMLISVPPQAKSASWGGLMTAGAQARGVQGVVISGRCRDLAEHAAARFPVFARGHSTLGQSPFTRPSEINVPLTIQPLSTGDRGEDFPAVTVQPGDTILADVDGVVCVPQELVDKVLELAAKGRDVDARCMEDIKTGKGIQAAFKAHRGKK